MAPSERSLLSGRPSSENERDLAEEDALLTGERQARMEPSPSKWKRWRELGLLVWAIIATAAVIIVAVIYQYKTTEHSSGPAPSGKRNLIFMVSDGMGPTSLSLTRSFRQYRDGLPYDETLVLDGHLIGQSRTRSTSSLVTDSAAGATAFGCGLKSYNGAIAVLPDHSPCGTVLEAAKKAGYMTGLVVTTRITDATPACFAAHVNMRSEEDRIAEQCHFLPNSTEGSCRADDKDVLDMAKEKGFTYINDKAGFDALKLGSAVKLPLLGLLADTDIPYEIDRRFEGDKYPSLQAMAETAMKALSAATKDSDKGFFLMIEGSRIDHAGHANDPAAQVHEVLAYDKAFASVLDFLAKDTVQGVMVSTSDHETGGLATARQLHATYPDYLWYPGVLANASHSAERLAFEYFQHRLSAPASDDLEAYLKDLVSQGLGIHDYSDEEIQSLVDTPALAPYTFAEMVSRRSQTGWSTHGHSAADVNIFASNPKDAAPLVGNHENTEIGEFLRNYLDVDVEAITKELKEKGTSFDTTDAEGKTVSWMGSVPVEGERLDGQDHLDHYQGDFRKHRRCEICNM
ncbi:vacuolar alkaline phosphatase [Coniosporium tulheliwenetii]|uniref:Vacuolar alkaline phosphatase n=1 Tax=Coniosporium tulheliwenetii TaxID=3383036 RepID=A0ACC2YME1_9PEZI|nr:vacuolar alkaline phosphatase [Cladosporium sp. JES 115]